MIDFITPGLWVLVATACGLALWRTYWPKTCTRWEGYVGLVAITAAFALAARAPGATTVAGAPNTWQRISTALFLAMSSIWWLVLLGKDKSGATIPPRAHYRVALHLLALCGGVLATSSNELATMWVGLLLYGIASRLAEGKRISSRWLAGTVALLLGIALLHTQMGTTALDELNRALWTLPGPMPPLIAAGAALMIGGIVLMTGLATPDEEGAAHTATPMLLGHLVLARCCLLGLGALWMAWSRTLLILGTLAIAWGWGASRRAQGTTAHYEALGLSQRGFALVFLALVVRVEAFRIAPLSVWLASVIAYALAQTGLMATLQAIVSHRELDQETVLDGLVRRQPLIGLPLLVQMASLAALPPTLGFTARLRAIAATLGNGSGGVPWLAIALLLATLWVGGGYVVDVCRIVRGSAERETEVSLAPAQCVLAAITALGGIVLGVVPLVERLAAYLATG